MAKTPSRLIVCVDGASQNTSSTSLQTNVHRIYSSIQRGICKDSSSGVEFNQITTYIPGLSSADDLISKERAYLRQIQDVYESCSRLSQAQDEVWLFGFGRGAFVVCAVAGLLHHFGAIASAGEPAFARDFKKLLKDSDALHGDLNLALTPTTSSTTSVTTRASARIQFVGVFETIRAINSDIFNTSFNSSVRHMRHALALHEDLKTLTPEALRAHELHADELQGISLKDQGRTFIEAYFIGSHADLGGTAKQGGLALYPCQWMLLEAWRCGLAVDTTRTADGRSDPLALDSLKLDDKKGQNANEKLWSFTTANGIIVQMRDLRDIHGTSRRHDNAYSVRLTSPKLGSIRQKKSREPFMTSGYLRGYCDFAPQGTIIHPSVYLLLDQHINISLETKELRLQRHIENWRQNMLGTSESGGDRASLWQEDEEEDIDDLGALRVLVCGNTGVGKSTLINKTFGVDVTQASNRSRGIHDVREPIVFEGRPDLILHDSGGFEAGADDEFKAIEAFLIERSASEDVLARVHVIWFCIDINSPRTLQTATEKLFLAISKHAKDVPIVVVATKKDELLDIEFGARRKMLKKEGKRLDEEECERYAEEKLQERIEAIRAEMESVPDGRLDACLAVSQDDDESISQLSKSTSHCFSTDHLRLLYVRAQVSRIDLKIDLAQEEIFKRYKKLVRSTGANFAPLGATITRKVSNAQIARSIINCFGVPTVNANVAMEALKANVWSRLGDNAQLALAELLHLAGMSATGFAFGTPVWLVTGSLNASHLHPTTCRMFLTMACDLTLVLARSFKESTFSGQPNENDVRTAARNYAIRGYSQHVHRQINLLIPKKSPLASLKLENVQRGVEDIFGEYKDKLMDDVSLPLDVPNKRIKDDVWDDTSTDADSLLLEDLKQATVAMSELEANEVPTLHELDGAKPISELPSW